MNWSIQFIRHDDDWHLLNAWVDGESTLKNAVEMTAGHVDVPVEQLFDHWNKSTLPIGDILKGKLKP